MTSSERSREGIMNNNPPVQGRMYILLGLFLLAQVFVIFRLMTLGFSNATTSLLLEDGSLRRKKDEIDTPPPCGGDKDVSVSPPSPHPVSIVPNQCDSPSRGYFDEIYSSGKWGRKVLPPSDFYGDAQWPAPKTRRVSASGLGSELGYNTESSLKIIKETILKYNATSMLDIPCGDVNWIFDSFETDSLPLYVGLDIAAAVIDVNKQRFAHHNNKQFYFWDATTCTLPKFRSSNNNDEQQPFDLVHVRDVIQHMHPKQGVQYFCNVFKSGAKVLITTTFPNSQVNKRIREGGYYENNLSKEPFSFPESNHCIPSHPNTELDDTCVYDLTQPWVQDFISAKCQ